MFMPPVHNAALPDKGQVANLNHVQKPRSLFKPGHRIMMNILPIAYNLFLPLFVFILCGAITAFWVPYLYPAVVWIVLIIVFIACAVAVALAIYHRTRDADPTWYTYLAIMVCIAAIWGTCSGMDIYQKYSKPYYQIEDMKVLAHVDASKELGQNLLDSGIVYFASGNVIDQTRSWHFKHETTYCVAPIVASGESGKQKSFDVWVVGKDCCSIGGSNFRCGDWAVNGARSAIRSLDDQSVKFYRLAVQQAEALYDVTSTNPVFFYSSVDPMNEVHGWRTHAFNRFCYSAEEFFVLSLITISITLCGFAYLGRAPSLRHLADKLAYQNWRKHGHGHARPQYGGIGHF
eukprot:TRINITY_DN17025_c0_g1_i1.p1 TRINITY_DN17025_c0_g1~~TRINITY_DN17025_c0_g1_i1.p1  ORF type:complete len:346 (-),score=19.72 TRINITY_DN17025_c0_g1_i1:231-1268(-)